MMVKCYIWFHSNAHDWMIKEPIPLERPSLLTAPALLILFQPVTQKWLTDFPFFLWHDKIF
jgi:hypothetical protein